MLTEHKESEEVFPTSTTELNYHGHKAITDGNIVLIEGDATDHIPPTTDLTYKGGENEMDLETLKGLVKIYNLSRTEGQPKMTVQDSYNKILYDE